MSESLQRHQLLIAAVLLMATVVGCGGSAGAPVNTLELTLTDTSIEGELLASTGQIRFRATNKGTKDHNLLAVGQGTRSYPPGAIETLDLGTLAPGKYAVWCDLVGHREAGMETVLTITQ